MKTRRQVQRLCLLVGALLSPAASDLRAQALRPAPPVLTEEPNWQAVCKRTLAQPLPAEAAALADTAQRTEKTSGDCDENRAFYGFDQPPNYPEALRCAYVHRAKPRIGAYVEGAGTLTMLYANGYGIGRSYELAIRFACEAAGTSASEESELRIGRLEALRDGKLASQKPFDLCDDAISGAMGSYCQYITERIADVGRARHLEAFRARLPAEAQAMLPKLEAAETAFEKARREGEYAGGGGSGSAGFVEMDQGQLREQFLINLQRFAAGDLRRTTAADRAQAEQQLKAAADAAKDFTPDPNAGPRQPTPQSLSATQQAWQALFIAWLRFVPIAYPQLSLDAAATELLRLRIHQLKRVAGKRWFLADLSPISGTLVSILAIL